MVSLHVCVLHCNHLTHHRLSTGCNNAQHNIQQWESIKRSCTILKADLSLSRQQITQKKREREINKVEGGRLTGVKAMRLKEVHSRMFSVPAREALPLLL